MNQYKHLTQQDRYTIDRMLTSGYSQAAIARTLGVAPSTISREVRRNKMTRSTYCAPDAHEHAVLARPPSPHRKSPKLWNDISKLLTDEQWSPEQISGWLRKRSGVKISHEAIYQYIYRDQINGGELFKNLRHSRRKRKKKRSSRDMRGCIKYRTSIDERPAVVEEKSRIGDWEADLVIGKIDGPPLVTLVDRMSKLTLIGLSQSKKACDVAATIISMLKPFKQQVQTVTYDNGKEFAYHHLVNDIIGSTSYFATPYHSWERGLNENTNGLIRQYFPKGMNFSKLDMKQIQEVEKKLNRRPRKTLDYATPYDTYIRDPTVALPS